MSQLVWVTVRHEHLHIQASVQQREVGLLLTTIGCKLSLHKNVMYSESTSPLQQHHPKVRATVRSAAASACASKERWHA
jgi:hypothetical protein